MHPSQSGSVIRPEEKYKEPVEMKSGVTWTEWQERENGFNSRILYRNGEVQV